MRKLEVFLKSGRQIRRGPRDNMAYSLLSSYLDNTYRTMTRHLHEYVRGSGLLPLDFHLHQTPPRARRVLSFFGFRAMLFVPLVSGRAGEDTEFHTGTGDEYDAAH